jgi:hypothetical protein
MLGLAGGAVSAQVADVQVVLIPVSLASLVLAYYFAYRRDPAPEWQRLTLWMSTPITVLSWLWPSLTR